jgi:hypothetical protein
MALTVATLYALRSGFVPTVVNSGEGSTSMGPPPPQLTIAGYNYQDTGSGYLEFRDMPAFNSGSAMAGYNGQPFTQYDYAGNVIRTGRLSGIANDSTFSTWGPFVMVAAGFAAAIAAGAGAAAAASASASSTAGGSGAFLGEGVASGVPAWDAAATSAGLQLTGGGFITETAADSVAGNLAPGAGTSLQAGGSGLSATSALSSAASLAPKAASVLGVLSRLINPQSTSTTPAGTPLRYTTPAGAGPLGVPMVMWLALGAAALLLKKA